MKKDDVEFIEVPVSEDEVTTYELKLVDIVLRQVTNPPKVESSPVTFQPNSRSIQKVRRQMRQASRTKRVFSALDQLGF